MVTVNILGIEVDFPFEPYDCQKKYMEKVIRCLQDRSNGVLESPTGTGKTLCLLCAALAWRETFMARLQLEHIGKLRKSDFNEGLESALNSASGNLDPGGSWERGFLDAPKIIYASRTHSQLAQAVAELKNTKYSPKVCVLGSREQMCINSEVMKEDSNHGKVHLCRMKVAARQCFYYNNLEASKSNAPSGIVDIEDLVSIGTEKKFCPYYMSRELKKEADLIFMPYNYVLDFKARNAHSIDLNNTVILIDEAHNVEKGTSQDVDVKYQERVCEENASFDLTSFDLASCVEDSQQCIEILLQNQEDGATTDDEASVGDLTIEDASLMKNLFLRLEAVVHDVELDDKGSITKPVRLDLKMNLTIRNILSININVVHCCFLFDQLNTLNVNSESRDQILETIEKMSGLLTGTNTKAFKRRNYALDKLASALKTLFAKSNDDASNRMQMQTSNKAFYKVHIHTEKKDDRKKSKTVDVWANKQTSNKEAGRTLSYWCFNPGLTMKDLLGQGVRSLILTSGTLSPLPSFKQELAVKFDVDLENDHVINGEQVFVGIIRQGPDGRKLNSSYKFRSEPEYQISLGNTVVNLSRIIPHGLLVFFPSYPVMDMILNKWQECGIWNRLSVTKGLYVEPRKKDGLNEAMEQFYEKIQDTNMKGAIFFAVCRGKVSEGLDFANNNGRAVIITGLPFPPSFDPRVVLKQQYLDENKKQNVISGREWYRQQASRAVNQAIGRVIRHKNDYGAILLCDERFSYNDAKAHLPAWIKTRVKEYKVFGLAQRDLVTFFRDIQQKMGVPESNTTNKRKLPTEAEENEEETLETYTNVKTKIQKTNPKSLAGFQVPSKPSGDVEFHAVAAHNSLANINTGVKKGSVFDSLNKGCSNSPGTSSGVVVKSTVFTAPKAASSTSISTTVRLKKKTFKLTKNDGSSINSKPTSSSANSVGEKSSSRPLQEGKATSNTPQSNAKEYLMKVKKTLPRDRYVLFGNTMSMYKKVFVTFSRKKELHKTLTSKISVTIYSVINPFVKSCLSHFETGDIQVLISNFQNVFDRTDLEHVSLFEGFSVFVTKKHRIDFEKACQTFSDIICVKCGIKALKPHTSPCQHIACYTCWMYTTTKQCHHLTCPVCKTTFKKRLLQRIYMDGQAGLYHTAYDQLIS